MSLVLPGQAMCEVCSQAGWQGWSGGWGQQWAWRGPHDLGGWGQQWARHGPRDLVGRELSRSNVARVGWVRAMGKVVGMGRMAGMVGHPLGGVCTVAGIAGSLWLGGQNHPSLRHIGGIVGPPPQSRSYPIWLGGVRSGSGCGLRRPSLAVRVLRYARPIELGLP